MSSPPDNAAICAAMVRDFDFSRYAASLFVPPAQRRAMLALAAFDLDILRIPDQVTQPLPGEVRLQWWTDALEGNAHGGVSGHPIAAELLAAIDTYRLPHAPLLASLAAHRFELYDEPMPSMAALEIYCDDTLGSLISIDAALLAEGARLSADLVRAAGRALGLVRLLSRLAHDAAHRRCLLPADLMAAHGVTRHQVLAGEDSAAMQAVRRDLIAAARRALQRAQNAARQCPKAVRPAFLPLATLDRELAALERFPPFAMASPPSRLRVLAAQWWAMREG